MSTNPPSILELARSRGHGRVEQAIEGHEIGLEAFARHLGQQLLGSWDFAILSIPLEKGVVCDDVWRTQFANLLREQARPLQVSSGDADVMHAV